MGCSFQLAARACTAAVLARTRPCGSALEAPARSAGHGAGGPDAERRPGCDDVEVPGRRPSARRAVGGREGAVAHLRWPSLGRVALRETLERGVVGHLGRRALDDEVEGRERYRDDAVRVLVQVPALASPLATHEV